MDPTTVAQAGEQLMLAKMVLTSAQYLWIYDYLLTVRDEIQYAWFGKRSWVFALFIGNRYTPLIHFIWVQFNMFHYDKPFCEVTKWVPTFHSIAGTIFAHTAVALRTYAITRMNKWVGGALGFVLALEVVNSIYAITRSGLGPLAPLPEVNLDPFKICFFDLWVPGLILYYSLTMLFDTLAFGIILFTAWKTRKIGHPYMPSILARISKDATLQFMFIFSAHCISLVFLFVTPPSVQLVPAMANTTFVPLMASRLMLSLKRAGGKQKKAWSLGTMTNQNWPGTIRFSSGTSGELQEFSPTPATLDLDDDIVLDELDVACLSHHDDPESPQAW